MFCQITCSYADSETLQITLAKLGVYSQTFSH